MGENTKCLPKLQFSELIMRGLTRSNSHPKETKPKMGWQIQSHQSHHVEFDTTGLTLEQQERILQQRKYLNSGGRNRSRSKTKEQLPGLGLKSLLGSKEGNNAKTKPLGLQSLQNDQNDRASLLEMMRARAKMQQNDDNNSNRQNHAECEQKIQQKDQVLQQVAMKLRAQNEIIQKQQRLIEELQQQLRNGNSGDGGRRSRVQSREEEESDEDGPPAPLLAQLLNGRRRRPAGGIDM